LDWLTDPIENGGGALTDFGCYGVNLITWRNKGARPESVMALAQTIKPELYPHVDDEATILLEYPKMQGIVQASWNWPISRKDMEVYGKIGYIYSDNKSDIRYRLNENEKEISEKLEERPTPYDDPFSLLAAIVRNKITLATYDLSSLENNMMVVEILEAAKKSAQTGKRVSLQN
jgi:predicted dehydrogenase